MRNAGYGAHTPNSSPFFFSGYWFMPVCDVDECCKQLNMSVCDMAVCKKNRQMFRYGIRVNVWSLANMSVCGMAI